MCKKSITYQEIALMEVSIGFSVPFQQWVRPKDFIKVSNYRKLLRDYIKFGEFDTKDNLEDEPLKWLAEANQMSGNMGWLPSLFVNQMA